MNKDRRFGNNECRLVATALRYDDLLLLFLVAFLWWEMREEISFDFRGFAKEWPAFELLDIGVERRSVRLCWEA